LIYFLGILHILRVLVCFSGRILIILMSFLRRRKK